MSPSGKPIVISRHAAERMRQRGATEAEVEAAIRGGNWRTAQRGKWHASQRFPFGQPSPVNQQTYAFKTVDAVFLEKRDEIIVVTVKVFYSD